MLSSLTTTFPLTGWPEVPLRPPVQLCQWHRVHRHQERQWACSDEGRCCCWTHFSRHWCRPHVFPVLPVRSVFASYKTHFNLKLIKCTDRRGVVDLTISSCIRFHAQTELQVWLVALNFRNLLWAIVQQRGAGPRRAVGGLRLWGRRCGRQEVLDRQEQVSQAFTAAACSAFKCVKSTQQE